ncbi:MAG: hypothetical protein QXH27_05775 [Candidatus Micrarchaeia archaeon]
MRTLAALALAVLLLLLGCAQPQPPAAPNATKPNITVSVAPPTPPPANVTPPPTGCEAEAGLAARDACWLAKAREGDWGACASITATAVRDECAFERARALNESAGCAGITNASLKVECERYFAVLACEREADENKRRACVAIAENNAGLCVGDADYVFAFAKGTGNASGCGGLPEAFLRKACEGVALANASVCGELTMSIQRDGCFERVAVELNRWDVCNLVASDTYRDSCLQKLALANKDSTLCSASSNTIVADACYNAVALAAKSPEACAAMSTDLKGKSPTRDICFFNVAKLLSDPSVCGSVVDDYYRSWFCYSTLIESGGYALHPSHCGNIMDRDSIWRDRCYYRVVKAQGGDKSLCAGILDKNVRRNCEEA